ncbi:MAG: gliding motility lipoprotein GldH [Bacteroidaceae bacterium]
MKNRTGRTYVLLTALLLVGCERNTCYHTYLPLPERGWDRQDTMSFLLPDGMEREGCSIEVEVRAMRSYPYVDFWLALQQVDSSRNVLHTDTLCVNMTDAGGIFTGHGMNFMEYSTDAVSLVADSAGLCRQLRVWHLMASERIYGITDVGLKVSAREDTDD